MCTSCKVQINGKGGQFSVAEGGQFYIAANNRDVFIGPHAERVLAVAPLSWQLLPKIIRRAHPKNLHLLSVCSGDPR